MRNKIEESGYPRGHGKKNAGIVLFWVGVAAIIVSFLIFFSFVDDIREPESITPTAVSFFVAVGGGHFHTNRSTPVLCGQERRKETKDSPRGGRFSVGL
jgi:hypothetical protein